VLDLDADQLGVGNGARGDPLGQLGGRFVEAQLHNDYLQHGALFEQLAIGARQPLARHNGLKVGDGGLDKECGRRAVDGGPVLVDGIGAAEPQRGADDDEP